MGGGCVRAVWGQRGQGVDGTGDGQHTIEGVENVISAKAARREIERLLGHFAPVYAHHERQARLAIPALPQHVTKRGVVPLRRRPRILDNGHWDFDAVETL